MSDQPYYCDACGRNLTPTAEELQALSRWGNPLRRPPCLETESGYHLVDPEQITERQFADLVRDYAYVRRTRSCKCGYPKVACLRVVLGNGPPYPPPPCEPARSPSRTESGLYPRGAVEGAIDALELAFSYIRDQGNHVCERRIEDALHYLRRAKEINEPRVNIRFLAANDEDSAVSNLVAAARVVNDELSHGEWSERSRARLNNALIDVDALSSEDATRPTGDKSGPEDGQSDTVPMKRPVMEGVDPAATDSGHVGASTYMWLIERGQAEHQEPTVWATKTGPMTWSQDPWAAILFQTKAAAESFIAEHLTHPTRGPSARVVQHGFSRPTGDKE